MEVVRTIIIILEVIASIALVLAVLFQSGKESGLGALSGNSETYLSKSKLGSLDKLLAAATKWVALAWAVLALLLSII